MPSTTKKSMPTRKLPKGVRERNGRYQMLLVRGGHQYSETFDTVEEAVEARRDIQRRLLAEAEAQGKSWHTTTLKNAVDRTYKMRWCDTKSERTHMVNARMLIKYFGPNAKLTEITTNLVNAMIEDLRSQGLSNSTINRKLACLSVILKTAEDCGYCTGKPVLMRRKEYRGRDRFVTVEEEVCMTKVLEQWGKLDHRDAVLTLIDTGMRTGELFKIQVQDVDFHKGKHGIITIWRTKNDHPRSVPLTKRVASVIKERLKTKIHPTERIFPFDQWWLRRVWDRMKQVIGLSNDKQFVPHILRHTCASRLVQRGVPLMMVQKWMGHESIQSTMRYSHLAPDALLDIVED